MFRDGFLLESWWQIARWYATSKCIKNSPRSNIAYFSYVYKACDTSSNIHIMEKYGLFFNSWGPAFYRMWARSSSTFEYFRNYSFVWINFPLQPDKYNVKNSSQEYLNYKLILHLDDELLIHLQCTFSKLTFPDCQFPVLHSNNLEE